MSDEARAFRCLVGYVTYAVFPPKIKDEDRRYPGNTTDRVLVLPFRTVAALVGTSPSTRGFAAVRWISKFSEAVFPLNPVDYWYSSGQARVIRPSMDTSLLALMLDCDPHPRDGQHVWLDTGTPVSTRTYDDRFRDKVTDDDKWASLLKIVPPLHPARPLLDYLSKSPQQRLAKLVRANWGRTLAAIEALPETTQGDRNTKDFSRRLAISTYENWSIFYTISDRSPRIFPSGESILYLPRDIRKVALAGTVECDLRAAQLAIAAKVWGLPVTEALLRSGKSIWEELAMAARLPVKSCKPILKKTLYSVIFGMTKANLRKNLEHGTDGLAGIGRVAMNRVFRHPVMKELVAMRKSKHREAKEQQQLQDAWGHIVPMGPGTNFRTVRSLWAYIIQSYELKILLSILPTLRRNSQIYLMAWQHDGVSLYFGNMTKKECEKKQIRRLVNAACADLNIATQLDMVDLL